MKRKLAQSQNNYSSSSTYRSRLIMLRRVFTRMRTCKMLFPGYFACLLNLLWVILVLRLTAELRRSFPPCNSIGFFFHPRNNHLIYMPSSVTTAVSHSRISHVAFFSFVMSSRWSWNRKMESDCRDLYLTLNLKANDQRLPSNIIISGMAFNANSD